MALRTLSSALAGRCADLRLRSPLEGCTWSGRVSLRAQGYIANHIVAMVKRVEGFGHSFELNPLGKREGAAETCVERGLKTMGWRRSSSAWLVIPPVRIADEL